MGRRKKHENVRALILSVATKLFSELGFAKTTVDDITTAANIGKATFYGEFSSKEVLLFTTLMAQIDTIYKEMERLANLTDYSVPYRIEAMLVYNLLTVYETAQQNIENTEQMIGLMMQTNSVEVQKEAIPRLVREYHLLVSLIEEGIRVGVFQPDIPAPLYARLLRNSLICFHPPGMFQYSVPELEFLARSHIRLMLAGMKVAPLLPEKPPEVDD